MASDKQVKKKCCHKYEKKGKHCKSCPELQQCILPFEENEKKIKKEKKEEKKREKELKKIEKKKRKKEKKRKEK